MFSVLSWCFKGDWWASWEDPAPRTWAWCHRRVSWIHLLLWRALTWGTYSKNEGKLVIGYVALDFAEFCNHTMMISISSVPSSYSMGGQGSVGAHWAGQSVWQIRYSGGFHCPSWCWSLPTGEFFFLLTLFTSLTFELIYLHCCVISSKNEGWGTGACKSSCWVFCGSSHKNRR